MANKLTEARAMQIERKRKRRKEICEKIKSVLEENDCAYGELFDILSDVADEYKALVNQTPVRRMKVDEAE